MGSTAKLEVDMNTFGLDIVLAGDVIAIVEGVAPYELIKATEVLGVVEVVVDELMARILDDDIMLDPLLAPGEDVGCCMAEDAEDASCDEVVMTTELCKKLDGEATLVDIPALLELDRLPADEE